MSVNTDTYFLCSMREELIWVTCKNVSSSRGRAVSGIVATIFPPLRNATTVSYDQTTVHRTEAHRGL